MADMTEIKDANGKTFSIDVSKICDINGDIGDKAPASITDSLQNRVAHVHDVEYVDSKGNALDSAKLLQDMKDGKVQVAALDVDMEATHSGKNHNYCIYYEDSMEKDAESFLNPFKKPVLKNHDSYSEPLGRIIQASHGPSAITDERSAIHLKARITDADAIPKFLDGRYGTVSIGGSMGTITCNICGKTILKDGKFKFCGHWRGETYKDEVCYWGAKDITYHEVSTVNNPADDFAQIMKVTVLTNGDDKKDSKEENKMAGNNTDANRVSADSIKKSVCDMIDELLGNSSATVSDSTTPENTEITTDEQPTAQDSSNAEPETVNSVQDTSELEKVQQELADANSKIKELEQEVADTKAELDKTKESLTASETDAAQFKEKCLALATANKELIADSIIKKENVEEDAKEQRKNELLAMSMKDLNKLAEETTVVDSQVRTPATVTSPALASEEKDEKNSNGTADANKNTTDDKKAKKTVDDFAQDIVSKLIK